MKARRLYSPAEHHPEHRDVTEPFAAWFLQNLRRHNILRVGVGRLSCLHLEDTVSRAAQGTTAADDD